VAVSAWALGTVLPLVALALSAISLAASIWTFTRVEKRSVRPVLVFRVGPDATWVIENVGNGPAMNVLVGEQSWQNKTWDRIIQCNPIAVRDSITLPWLREARELAATYTDVSGRRYTSWCQSHLTEVLDGNKFGGWEPTGREYETRLESETLGS